jgi:hypothetical protein
MKRIIAMTLINYCDEDEKRETPAAQAGRRH